MAPTQVDIPTKIDDQLVLSRMAQGVSEARRRGRPVLVSVTMGVPTVDPLVVFDRGAQLGGDRRFWSAPNANRTIVGLGAAWTHESTGPDRFADAGEAWRAYCADAIVNLPSESDVTGPVVMAGFSFDPEQISTDLWSDFPDGLLVLPRYSLTTVDGRSWLTVNARIEPDSDLSSLKASVERLSFLLASSVSETGSRDPNIVAAKSDARTAVDWQSMVGDAARRLREGEAEKVVLALSTRLSAQRPFDPTRALRRLQADYPSCYVFAIDRGGSCFLGASPEQLAQVEGATVRTVCLAGSAPRGATVQDDVRLGDGLLASVKNRNEHAIVVRWVRDTLTQAGIELSPLVEPSLLRFRNVQHLFTPVDGSLPAGGTVLDVVAHLHPTPSVGGHPRKAALSFIRDHEGLDRGWYAGAVGWIDSQGQGEFAVAIRSALLRGSEAVLFAGCGVVPDSVPEQEYAEAQMKLRPMLAALGEQVG